MSQLQDFNVKVEIKNEDIKIFSGVSSKTGNSFSIRSQDCSGFIRIKSRIRRNFK